MATGDYTGTTVLAFLMVFVLQHSLNRDAVMIQAKLDDLIVCTKDAGNDLEEQVEILREDRTKQARAV
jgi:low affinity Fe/Cu permease